MEDRAEPAADRVCIPAVAAVIAVAAVGVDYKGHRRTVCGSVQAEPSPVSRVSRRSYNRILPLILSLLNILSIFALR